MTGGANTDDWLASMRGMTLMDIVVFNVSRDADGLYTATSPHLDGVCVVHRDRAKIIEDLPNIVRLWYRRHGQDVDFEAVPSQQ